MGIPQSKQKTIYAVKRTRSRPTDPRQLTRSFVGAKATRDWVDTMRDKYEVEIGQQDVPDGLHGDVQGVGVQR